MQTKDSLTVEEAPIKGKKKAVPEAVTWRKEVSLLKQYQQRRNHKPEWQFIKNLFYEELP